MHVEGGHETKFKAFMVGGEFFMAVNRNVGETKKMRKIHGHES